MKISYSSGGWQPIVSNVFWTEVAPRDHVVQIYEKKEDFLDLLENFVIEGIRVKDFVLVIATASNLSELQSRLELKGLSEGDLVSNDLYIPFDAEKALSKFMVNGWPDEVLFMQFIESLTRQACQNNLQIRAFGEMVAILWGKGETDATIALEALWNKFSKNKNLSLFCAYPKSGLTLTPSSSVMDICCSHTKMITNKNKSKTEMFYKNTGSKNAI